MKGIQIEKEEIKLFLLANNITVNVGNPSSVKFSHSVVSNSVTPWTAARQASLSFTISWSLLKFMSIESLVPSSYPLFSPSPPAPSLSQHQGLFQ